MNARSRCRMGLRWVGLLEQDASCASRHGPIREVARFRYRLDGDDTPVFRVRGPRRVGTGSNAVA